MNTRTFHSEKSFIASTVDFIMFLKPQTIALSGGSTPGPVYKTLAKAIKKSAQKNGNSAQINTDATFQNANQTKSVPAAPAEWREDIFLTTFYQVDERYIPRTSRDSNYKLIIDSGLKLTHFFDTSLSIEKSLVKYSTELPKKFDLIILGIGKDGHIASIFPHQSPDTSSRDGGKGSDHLAHLWRGFEKVTHTLAPKTSPVKDRLTLTIPYILAAKNIIVLLKNKPEILKKLQSAEKSLIKSGTKTSPPHTQTEIADFPALALLKRKNLTIHHLKQ